MKKDSKIYIAGHNGMVGSAITRKLTSEGYTNLVFTPFPPYDLTNQQTVAFFFKRKSLNMSFWLQQRLEVYCQIIHTGHSSFMIT